MRNQPTKTVEVERTHAGLLMTWQRKVEQDDVDSAFKKLVKYLDAASEPVHVIVDVSKRPMFPMLKTTACAITAFCHPNTAGWCVVGESSLARIIEQTLGQLSGRCNTVEWFQSMADLHGHLQIGAIESQKNAASYTHVHRRVEIRSLA